ncbi:uncharacterized protein LOC111243783 [Varroa destructor]|uniref:Tetraspanin n=1 Tax=Varroa destructor TaxID=109461 RepID=A0A7M7J332_VARDE|nr:uncharacterized protein LOC111243783 [Varroa destructor]
MSWNERERRPSACAKASRCILVTFNVLTWITPWFSEKIRNMIVLSKVHKQDAITFLDHVQERLKCCGGRSFVDYTENEMDMPWSCYYGEGNVQLRGCGEVLVQHFRENALAVGLVTLGILFLQIGLCACALVQFFDKQVVRPRLQASSV